MGEEESDMTNGAHHLKLDFTVDQKGLYCEESFYDLKVASIRRLTPVHVDGSPDESREPIFLGYTQVMSPKGPVSIHSKIEALSLEDAIDKFPEAMHQAADKMIAEAGKAEGEDSSHNVAPGAQGS